MDMPSILFGLLLGGTIGAVVMAACAAGARGER